MDFDQTLHARRATRNYTPEPVGEVLLNRLIEAAIQAPSALDEQPWAFSVIRDRTALDRISSKAKVHAFNHPPPGVALEDLHERLYEPAFNIFYHAPVLIVISSRTQSRWAAENCALAAGNMMLCAASMGLGSCWIGLACDWLRTWDGKVEIGVPAAYLPVAPIVVGYPAGTPAPVARNRPEIIWVGQPPVRRELDQQYCGS